jgi:glycosyltransferase involved in cell wall biosynthesis
MQNFHRLNTNVKITLLIIQGNKVQNLNRPIRIMHIISGDLWAGAEVQAYTLLKHLAPQTDLYVILMNHGELADRLNKLGITTQIINEQQYSNLSIISKIFKAIGQFKPDVIHTHRQKENILGSFANLLSLIQRGRLTPSIRTAHGAPEFNPKGKQKIQVWLDRWVGKWLQKKVIAVSQDLSKKLEGIFPAKQIVVIQNGVDQESLRQQGNTADFRVNQPDKTHVGIIGRLEPVKRIDIFLEMAALLLREHPQFDWAFHVIGDGKLRSHLELQARQSGIAEDVHFHGHRTDIPSCIASLDAIIMCSDHEGTPMTALEALALGKPVIAHAVGGLKEIFKDYPDLLVTNHFARSYANNLLAYLGSDAKSCELDAHYHAETNAISTINLYQMD